MKTTEKAAMTLAAISMLVASTMWALTPLVTIAVLVVSCTSRHHKAGAGWKFVGTWLAVTVSLNKGCHDQHTLLGG